MSTSPSPIIDTLIIVCAHAIYLGPSTSRSTTITSSSTHKPNPDESDWLLEPFQAGETPTYIRHIEAGVKELVESHGRAILVFSGGRTKRDRTEMSEGEGYFNLALSHNLFGHNTTSSTTTATTLPLQDYIFIDTHATDSYQNLLFPLVQFPAYLRQLSSKPTSTPSPNQSLFPRNLTIISHAFKSARFLKLHIPALRFPFERVKYVGIDPPFLDPRSEEYDVIKAGETLEGERERGVKAWEGDLYGVGKGLGGKRTKRGWVGGEEFERVVFGKAGGGGGNGEVGIEMTEEVEEVLKDLLRWSGGESGKEIFPEVLPWE